VTSPADAAVPGGAPFVESFRGSSLIFSVDA